LNFIGRQVAETAVGDSLAGEVGHGIDTGPHHQRMLQFDLSEMNNLGKRATRRAK